MQPQHFEKGGNRWNWGSVGRVKATFRADPAARWKVAKFLTMVEARLKSGGVNDIENI